MLLTVEFPVWQDPVTWKALSRDLLPIFIQKILSTYHVPGPWLGIWCRVNKRQSESTE